MARRSRRELSKRCIAWDGSPQRESPIRLNINYFCQGQISRADRRANLHGKAVSHMWVSPLWVPISLRVSKCRESKIVLFAQFICGVSSSLCVVNTTTQAWRTPPCLNGLVYSADCRRHTCVLNGAVDIVYRASTVVADVL